MQSSFQKVSAAIRQNYLGLLPAGVGLLLLALCTGGCESKPNGAAAGSTVGQVAPKSSGSGSDASARTNATVAVAKSVFHSDDQAGRDPFFPDSRRTSGQQAATIIEPRLPAVSYLKLVGIRPGTTRPLALINKTVLGPGEEGDVAIVVPGQANKPEVQKINVHCLEVRRDSVLIRIAGEQGVKELRIAQGTK